MSAAGPPTERNQDATVYVGNLDPLVDEEMVWEMFREGGVVVSVFIPKDRVSSEHQGFGFVEFKSEEDADYGMKIMNMIKLFGKPIRVNKASQDKKIVDIGANLFVGNLDPDTDEKMIYDTFSAFGTIINTPKIMREETYGSSKGFGFISYDNFEAGDAAIAAMHGQYMMNRQITVTFAFRKDSREKHGSEAERYLASAAPSPGEQAVAMAEQFKGPGMPNMLFSSGPGQPITGPTATPPGMPPPPGAPGAPGMPPPPPGMPPGIPGMGMGMPPPNMPPPMPSPQPYAQFGAPMPPPPGLPGFAGMQRGPPGMPPGMPGMPPGMPGMPPGMPGMPPGMPPPPGFPGMPGMPRGMPPGAWPPGMPPPPGGFR